MVIHQTFNWKNHVVSAVYPQANPSPIASLVGLIHRCTMKCQRYHNKQLQRSHQASSVAKPLVKFAEKHKKRVSLEKCQTMVWSLLLSKVQTIWLRSSLHHSLYRSSKQFSRRITSIFGWNLSILLLHVQLVASLRPFLMQCRLINSKSKIHTSKLSANTSFKHSATKAKVCNQVITITKANYLHQKLMQTFELAQVPHLYQHSKESLGNNPCK